MSLTDRERIEELEEEVRGLRELLAHQEILVGSGLGLTRMERRVLTALLSRDVCSSGYLVSRVYRDAEEPLQPDNGIQVRICWLRRKLAPLGISISVKRDVGYSVAPPRREALRRIAELRG